MSIDLSIVVAVWQDKAGLERWLPGFLRLLMWALGEAWGYLSPIPAVADEARIAAS